MTCSFGSISKFNWNYQSLERHHRSFLEPKDSAQLPTGHLCEPCTAVLLPVKMVSFCLPGSCEPSSPCPGCIRALDTAGHPHNLCPFPHASISFLFTTEENNTLGEMTSLALTAFLLWSLSSENNSSLDYIWKDGDIIVFQEITVMEASLTRILFDSVLTLSCLLLSLVETHEI